MTRMIAFRTDQISHLHQSLAARQDDFFRPSQSRREQTESESMNCFSHLIVTEWLATLEANEIKFDYAGCAPLRVFEIN